MNLNTKLKSTMFTFVTTVCEMKIIDEMTSKTYIAFYFRMHDDVACILRIIVCLFYSLFQVYLEVIKPKYENETIIRNARGYNIDLLNIFAKRLNFTYDLFASPDGKYGAMNKDGTWNGMIGYVKDKVS